MDASPALASALRGRWSVAAMFFVNGFLTGSWAPQIPITLARLDITPFAMGLLILLFGAGALASMSWCGHLIGRYGSRRVLLGFAAVAVFSLLAVALSPDVPAIAVALFVFGAVAGGMDVAMNANAVEVERRLARPIMSSSHGFWSLGGFAGGGFGGLAIEHWGYLAHAGLTTVIALVVALLAARGLITEAKPAVRGKLRLALPRQPAIYLVGIMALFSMVPEGAVLDWATVYIKEELGASIAVAGFGYSVFAGAMALVRFAGDRLRDRYGAVATLRISSLIAAAGIMTAGFSSHPFVAVAAFAFAGLGVANMVPIAFSAAGNQPGLSPGAGISTVTLMGYAGILVAPSAIGFIGGHVGFAPVFVGVSFLLIVVFLLAGLARAADLPRARQGE